MSAEEAVSFVKRLLSCETWLGIVASVHLEKVNMRTGSNAELGRKVYSWIFDAHHVVMGDMNTTWGAMIGGAAFDFGSGVSHATPKEAWVRPETHASAVRPGGTYLPGLAQPKMPRWKGDRVTIEPPTFDLVVVGRPLSVELLPKQPGKRFVPAKLPRELMQKLPPDGWPSDHTSVVAVVEAVGGAPAAACSRRQQHPPVGRAARRGSAQATPHTRRDPTPSRFQPRPPPARPLPASSAPVPSGRRHADGRHVECRRSALLCPVVRNRRGREPEAPPMPHASMDRPPLSDPPRDRYRWPDAALGFDPDREAERLDAIARHVSVLLETAEVVGLQEVPGGLVSQLVALGRQHACHVQWVAAPAEADEAWYDVCAGRFSCTPAGGAMGGTAAAATSGSGDAAPPVAHDMLYARHAVLLQQDEEERESAPAVVVTVS